MSDASDISPTAFFTGHVWYRHGLGHRALHASPGGPSARAIDLELRRMPPFQAMLLRRHLVLDELLAQKVEAGVVRQILEIGAGLSARGLRFMQRYGSQGLRYIEGDLADIATLKRARLDQARLRGANYHIRTLDARRAHGAESLTAVVDALVEPSEGLAIVTEGLVNYVDRATAMDLWARIAAALGRCASGVYLTEVHVRSDLNALGPQRDDLATTLAVFDKRVVHLPYDDPTHVQQALAEAGFHEIILTTPQDFVDRLTLPEQPGGGDLLRIVEAQVRQFACHDVVRD